MPTQTQAIDYNNITNTIVAVLTSANSPSAPYDLSLGLTRRVSQITRDDLFVVPKFKSLYPIVAVGLDLKRESFVDYNINKRGREVDLVFSIVCVLENYKDAERETWNLVRNIDAILRDSVTLNYYKNDLEVVMLWSTGCSFSIEFMGANIGNFLFKSLISNESAFCKASQVNLTVKCYLPDERQLRYDGDTFNENYYGDNY